MYEIKYRDESDFITNDRSCYSTIPLNWRLSKIKHVASLKTGNSISATDKDEKYSNELKDYYRYIGTKDIESDTNIISYENDLFIPKRSKFKTAPKNSSLICIEGGSAGKKIGYLDRDVCFGNKLCNVVANKNATNKFIYYYLQSRKFIEQINLKMNGIIPGVSVEELKNIDLILSNLTEQQKIVNFLDIKTAQFDEVIAKKELLINKLEEAKKSLIFEVVTGKVKIVDGQLVQRDSSEMKDSGIEWLRAIPVVWSTKRAQYLFRESSLKSIKGKEEPLSMSQKYGLIKSSDMDRIPNQALSNAGSKICKENDLVFNKLKSHLGVFSVSQYTGLVSPDYAVYKPLHGTNSKYYEYLFKTPLYINEFNKYSKGVGAGLTRLYTQDLFNIVCIYPNLETQNEIARFLNKKVIDADSIINKVEHELIKIREAKQSLISEAVTGKIDLRDWEIIEEEKSNDYRHNS